MKKFFMGLIIGAVLMVGTSSYAEEVKNDVLSLIGFQVQGTFPVKINEDTLTIDAIVVDNKSYLPVRVIGELFKSDISFIDNQVLIKPTEGAIDLDKLAQMSKEKNEALAIKLAEIEKRRIAEAEETARIKAEGDKEMQMIKEELERKAKEAAESKQQE